MSGDREDQTLTCVQCGSQFVFSGEEQEFFESKGLGTPKRCKDCRAERRRGRRGGGRGGGGRGGGRGPRLKEYRGPAFRDEDRRSPTYRSPAFRDATAGEGIYTAPAFRERDGATEEIYTAPAFREREEIDQAIYTSPAFKAPDHPEIAEGILPATWRRPAVDEDGEPLAAAPAAVAEGEHDLELGPPPDYREPTSPHEMYRAPAFADTDPAGYAPSYRRREMTEIVCAGCGKKSRVPFRPQKDRPVFCKECFQKKRAGGGGSRRR